MKDFKGTNVKKAAKVSETDGVKYRRVKGWQLALAMMHAASIACFFGSIGYVSYAANLGFGISTVLVGTLMTVARIFDGITDPLISILIDKVNTRFGKIRIFMVIGWLIEALAIMMLYNWLCGKGHSIGMFMALYLFYYIGYTIHNMAGQLVSPVITNDPKQRPMVGVCTTVYNYIVNMVIAIGVTVVLLPSFGNNYTVELLASLSKLVVGLSFVFLVLALIGLTPIDKPENFLVGKSEEKQTVRLKDMVDLLKNNRALQCFIFAATSDKLATNINGQSIVTTILFGIIVGNMGLSAILNMIAIIPAFIFAAVGAKYIGKHGSKEANVFWTRASIILNVVTIVFMLVTTNQKISSSVPLIIGFAILTMAKNGIAVTVSTATSSMMADVVDYEAYRSGKYLPGVVAGVYSFIDKLVSSLGAVIATACVALVGYTASMPQPTDPKTMPVLLMGVFLVYGVPILGWICTLIAMKFTPLSKEKMVEVQKKIAEMKENA